MTQDVKPRRIKEQSPFKVELRPDLWDGRLSSRDREVLTQIAEKYALDPLTGEVMMLRGKVYITAAGLQKLAVRDPNYEGCEIEIVQADWEKNFYVIKARVWKKGCSHPFEDFGDADPSTSSLRGRALFRHAITRARARAMRSAFAIPFCSVEELDGEMRANSRPSSRSNNRQEHRSQSQQQAPRNQAPRNQAPRNQARPEQKPAPAQGHSDEGGAPPSKPSNEQKAAAPEKAEVSKNEASELGEKLHKEMMEAKDINALKRIWGDFQEVRMDLPEIWVTKIRNAKDERKSTLTA